MAVAARKEFLDFQQLLERYIKFDEIDFLVTHSIARLFLGAVDILSGEFKAVDGEKQADKFLKNLTLEKNNPLR